MNQEPGDNPQPAEESRSDRSVATDAAIDVTIDDELTSAVLTISAEMDSVEITAPLLLQYLRDHDVLVNSDAKRRVDELVGAYLANGGPIERVVSESTPPEHGSDGGFEWVEGYNPETDSEAEQAGEAADDSDDERVDFYNCVSYIRVTAEDHVATLLEATDGEDGLDVKGGIIPAKPGKRFNINIDRSLKVDRDGRVTAGISGMLEYKKGTLRVVQLLEVSEYVDFSTGNIDFEGSVVVREGVRDRFVVKATENLTVDGLVEGATLIAGGDLHCRRGMAAKERGGVLVDGDVHVGYLNNVRARIKGNLVVRRELMDCELVVGGGLLCDQGAIVGGRVVVTREVTLGTLGSGAAAPTELVLGEVPLVANQLHRLQAMMKEFLVELEEKTQAKDELAGSKAVFRADEKERITELTFEVDDLQRKLEACEQKREELLEQIRKSRMVSLRVNRAIHGRVVLKIGGRSYQFRDQVKGPITIGWDAKREVRFRVADGDSRAIYDIAQEIDIKV